MDASKADGHIAQYGNVSIERRMCPDCNRLAFVIQGRMACCALRVETGGKLPSKRMSDVPLARKGPSRKVQKAILEEQDNRCLYCEHKFGTSVWRGQRKMTVRLHWDHLSPYVYSLDNRHSNFVAACSICNGIKGSLVFESINAIRVYVYGKRLEKGYSDVPTVRKTIQPETAIAKVLPPEL